MKRLAWALVLALSASSAARAEDFGQTWSAVGPKTVAPGSNSLEFAAGWPGLSVGYYRGVLPGLNVGARVAFVYGVEGMVRYVEPGFKAQALLKWRLVELDRLTFGLTFEPGPFFHAPYFGGTVAGFSLPVGFRLGLAASSALTVAVLVEVPMWVSFGPRSDFHVPVLTGVGLEYFVSSTLGLFVRVRVGPTIHTSSGPADLTFEGSLGVALRL